MLYYHFIKARKRPGTSFRSPAVLAQCPGANFKLPMHSSNCIKKFKSNFCNYILKLRLVVFLLSGFSDLKYSWQRAYWLSAKNKFGKRISTFIGPLWVLYRGIPFEVVIFISPCSFLRVPIYWSNYLVIWTHQGHCRYFFPGAGFRKLFISYRCRWKTYVLFKMEKLLRNGSPFVQSINLIA